MAHSSLVTMEKATLQWWFSRTDMSLYSSASELSELTCGRAAHRRWSHTLSPGRAWGAQSGVFCERARGRRGRPARLERVVLPRVAEVVADRAEHEGEDLQVREDVRPASARKGRQRRPGRVSGELGAREVGGRARGAGGT